MEYVKGPIFCSAFAAAVKMFHDVRKGTSHAVLFRESALNLLGYQYLQAGNAQQAIELFKLNTEASPPRYPHAVDEQRLTRLRETLDVEDRPAGRWS